MAYKRKILVVEDNPLNRELLGLILSEEYDVLEADNGLVALNVLNERASEISLILLDVMMPVMNGYTFLDRMKASPSLSLILVIVMTQSNSEEDELAALAHGATDFLPKPYRPKIILHRVAALIKLRETAAIVNQLQYDHLTGLYTREYFFQRVRQQLKLEPNGKFCIIASNVENFKLIKDIFGVREAEGLLKEIASTAKRMVGENGFCGVFGGDRFLFFQKQEQELLDRFFFLESQITARTNTLKGATMRWGIYEIKDRTIPVEQMCDRALLAADSIKRQYNRHFAIYDDSLRSQLLREQAITSAMVSALENREFIIYLQPKYHLQHSQMAGAEALVRWIHPEWGFMSPGEFIPLFEKNGFISKLDLYVWEQTLVLLDS